MDVTGVVVQPMRAENYGSEHFQWEYDSNIDITVRGVSRQMQVWRRPSLYWEGEHEFTMTEDRLGAEHRPKPGSYCWTSLDAFKKRCPHFGRNE